MSFSFQIESTKRISYKNLRTELGVEGIEYSNSSFDSDDKIEKTTLFIANKSVRGVFLEFKDLVYSIKIRTVSSEDDIHLAVQTCLCIARITDSLILAEGVMRALSIEEVQDNYNSEWIENIKYFGIEQYIEELDKRNGTFAFWLCYMNFFIGPKVHKKLDSTSVESYYNSLMNHLRSNQFFDRTKYIQGQVRVLKNEKTGEVKETITFYAHGSEFLRIADSIIFIDLKNAGYYIEVPYSFMRKIKHDKIKLIDEVQYLIDELTLEEYDGIYKSVEKIANYLNKKNTPSETKTTPPKSTSSPRTKKTVEAKWWEFWKK